MKKLIEWKNNLPETVTMTTRECVLALLVCLFAGMIAGMLCSPNRSTMIASHNGNTCWKPEEDEEEIEEV